MAILDFVSVFEDAVVASGGSAVGVIVDASGEIQSFGAGRLGVDLADQASRALIFVASRLMFQACNNLGPATELRWPVSDHRRGDSNIRTFDLTVAAAILHMSPWKLRQMANKGIVPGAKIGRRWFFSDEALAEYLRCEIKKQTAARCGKPPNDSAPVPTVHVQKGRRRWTPPPLDVLLANQGSKS